MMHAGPHSPTPASVPGSASPDASHVPARSDPFRDSVSEIRRARQPGREPDRKQGAQRVSTRANGLPRCKSVQCDQDHLRKLTRSAVPEPWSNSSEPPSWSANPRMTVRPNFCLSGPVGQGESRAVVADRQLHAPRLDLRQGHLEQRAFPGAEHVLGRVDCRLVHQKRDGGHLTYGQFIGTDIEPDIDRQGAKRFRQHFAQDRLEALRVGGPS